MSTQDWEIVGKRSKRPQDNASAPRQRQRQAPNKQQKSAQGRKAISKRIPPAKLVDLDDGNNEAQQMWRDHRGAAREILIPDELAWQDQSYEIIAGQHGTFVHSASDTPRGGPMKFGIWGESTAVEATVHGINAWIADWRQSTGSKTERSVRFSKVVSLTPVLRERAERRWLKDVKKEKYRQMPPFGSKFEAIGNFHWPAREFPPEEILGKSYEALDPIRMELECYVVFVKERSAFQVLGKATNIQTALLRLRRTCFQVVARSLNPMRDHLLSWTSPTRASSHVQLKPYSAVARLGAASTVSEELVPLADGMRGDNEDTIVEAGIVAGERRVEAVLMQTLKKLHYFRGSIELSVHLGTFVLSQYRRSEGGIYELGDFEAMMQESQFVGRVTHELGDKDIEYSALAALQLENSMLKPQGMEADSLTDVKPVYTAIFTFADEAGDLQLTKTWCEMSDTSAKTALFEETTRKWTRLDRDASTSTALLDVNMIDIDATLAWNISIRSQHCVNERRLAKALIDFSYSIQIQPELARKQNIDKAFVTYKAYGVKLKSLQLRISYHFDIRTGEGMVTDYALNLTRFQDRVFAHASGKLAPVAEPVVCEPRWALNVYRNEWATKFAVNESLKVGEVADWNDDIESWFPQNPSRVGAESKDAGLEHFIDHLHRIAKVVQEIKEEDLIGGMTVG